MFLLFATNDRIQWSCLLMISRENLYTCPVGTLSVMISANVRYKFFDLALHCHVSFGMTGYPMPKRVIKRH